MSVDAGNSNYHISGDTQSDYEKYSVSMHKWDGASIIKVKLKIVGIKEKRETEYSSLHIQNK